MNNLQSHSQSAATISSGPFSKSSLHMIGSDISESEAILKTDEEKSDFGTLNIPKLNLEAIRQSSSPEKENFEKEKTIYATTKNNYSTQTKQRISNRKFNAPHNLGRARELPQVWVKRIKARRVSKS